MFDKSLLDRGEMDIYNKVLLRCRELRNPNPDNYPDLKDLPRFTTESAAIMMFEGTATSLYHAMSERGIEVNVYDIMDAASAEIDQELGTTL